MKFKKLHMVSEFRGTFSRKKEVKFSELSAGLQENLERKYLDTFGSITIVEEVFAEDGMYLGIYQTVKSQREHSTTRRLELCVTGKNKEIVREPVWISSKIKLPLGNEVE